MWTIELGPEVAAIAAENGARDRFEQDSLGLTHPVRPQQIRTAWSMLPRAPRTIVESRGELRVHLVQIADGVLVENHDVGGQTLEPPVLLRLEDLACQRNVVVADDAHQQDRQIARDAVRPQTGLAELVRRRSRPGSPGASRR